MKRSLAAAAVLALISTTAVAQTTGVGLSAPGNVQPNGTGRPSGPAPAIEANPDPFESFNRKSYAFSNTVDRVAIRPGAIFYKRATPRPIRTGLRNMIQNIGEPVVFVNDVLQLRFRSAASTVCRFVGNTTIGIGGIFDFAGATGLPHHDNGFGITLGRYGVRAGPYFYVPVLGPTTLRDGVGSGVDGFTDPLAYSHFSGDLALNLGRPVVGGLDVRSSVDKELKQLQTVATDPYATIRSVYLQNKQAQISGGNSSLESLPDFPDQPGAAGGSRGGSSAGAMPDMPSDPGPPPAPSQPTPPPSGSTNPA